MAENIQYKDAVFRSYFKDKHRVLSLYRAVSGDNSLTEDDIELNDLAEALVNGKRNDVSFISGNKLIVLIEHQSTINYNMPLRFLSYLSKFYNKLTSSKATYNKERIPLPSPQFYVFYNGRESTEVVNMFTEEWNLEEAKRVAAEEAAKEARNESKIEAIIEMLKDQLPVEKISKYTKFSVEQIEEIGARHALL